jgi:GDP-4-dehydro-6-deoxy-D-mannose reductase
VGSGKAIAIQELLNILVAASSATMDVQPDPDRLRPVNVPLVVCDASRLQARTGWEPAISVEQSLRDILADARVRVRHAQSVATEQERQ